MESEGQVRSISVPNPYQIPISGWEVMGKRYEILRCSLTDFIEVLGYKKKLPFALVFFEFLSIKIVKGRYLNDTCLYYLVNCN